MLECSSPNQRTVTTYTLYEIPQRLLRNLSLDPWRGIDRDDGARLDPPGIAFAVERKLGFLLTPRAGYGPFPLCKLDEDAGR